jgi:2-polyprenyl-3-methyl-5-hydroxy-6-metoxy-1,4-benzoquinol methylase
MEHGYCPLCYSRNFKKMRKYSEHFLSKCKACSFVFSYKIPEKFELDALYNGYGYYEKFSTLNINRYDKLLTEFNKYKQTNKILDYGCGNGYFLERAQLQGWNTFGIEYDKYASEQCVKKNITMIAENESSLYEKFDIVFISEVIEHVISPKQVIETINKYLRKKGLLYITTPNFNSISRLIMKSKWSALGYPEHISYFTSFTIKELLLKSNFSIDKSRTHGISLSQLKLGTKNKSDSDIATNVTSTDEVIREITQRNQIMKFLKNTTNWILTIFKKGDTIKCFAIKQNINNNQLN